jgi:hypothetical protein
MSLYDIRTLAKKVSFLIEKLLNTFNINKNLLKWDKICLKILLQGKKVICSRKRWKMMSSSYRGLLEEIEIQRNDMVRLASETSLSNHKVIEASKRLDCLLNNYHLLLAQ